MTMSVESLINQSPGNAFHNSEKQSA